MKKVINEIVKKHSGATDEAIACMIDSGDFSSICKNDLINIIKDINGYFRVMKPYLKDDFTSAIDRVSSITEEDDINTINSALLYVYFTIDIIDDYNKDRKELMTILDKYPALLIYGIAIKIIKFRSHLSTDQITKMIETGSFNELSKDTIFIISNNIISTLKSIKIIFSNTFIVDAINRINDYADEKEAAALLCYLFDVIDKKYFATHPSC
jgi:hypothetical protein